MAKERLSDLPEVTQAGHYGAGNSTKTPKQQTDALTPGLSVLLLLSLKTSKVSARISEMVQRLLKAVRLKYRNSWTGMCCLGVEL